MSIDSLSLENIDEFVNDESKIVTVKWLSLTLKVHCNAAKQLLYKFVENERNVKGNDKITVTYFVSGLSKPDENGEQTFKFAVVPESKLETYKSTLKVVTSCHIYSAQKIKLKDSNALYMTDYDKLKENIYDSNKYSSIHYDKAVLRSEDDLDLLRVPLTTTKQETDKKTTAVSNGVAGNKPAEQKGSQSAIGTKPGEKKGPQSAIASMFAKADQKKTTAKTEQKDTANVSDKKGGGMMSFFPKQSEKKEELTASKTGGKPEKKDKKQEIKGTSKKARPVDSDEENNIGKSKRRRIKPDILDSSSEEEIDAEDEEPIPPTPPRQPSPAPREPSPTPQQPSPEPKGSTGLEEEDPVPKEKAEKKDSNKGEKKRKRTKKLVPKTYMAKDGFMVTEKVWESESTDASESEEPVAKVTKTTEPAKPKTSPAKGRQKGSPKKKSPQGKKGPGSGGNAKQTSLMSFFKKT